MSRTFLAEVPVVPVLFALGQEADKRGRYYCPFHDDRRPGGKPSAEVRDDPCVLSCWSCETDATAAMLAAKIRGTDLRAGLEFALSVAGQIEAKPRRRAPGPSPARLEAEYARLTTDVRWPGDVDPVAEFVESRGWGGAVWRYVTEEWGWRGDYRGRVLMPHRSYDGEMTGIKYRLPPDWQKESRPRSSYPQLYGAWRLARVTTRDRGVRPGDDESSASSNVIEEVWVLEGETDTAWAGFWLDELGVGTLGMPGAGYRLRPGEVEMLRGRRVVLAVDGDAKGAEARDRVGALLDDVADEIEVVKIPAGEDLCTLPVTPREIWERMR